MNEHTFDTREAASIAAAERIAAALARRLEAQDEASVVVSGGTTPARCLEELRGADLNWPGVHVVLSDERWVPPDDDDSNEKMIRDTLLQGAAADATLLGIYDAESDAASRCAALTDAVKTLPFPFACALLGMGADGHFASLFPDADNIAEALDTESAELWVPVRTAASPHPRVSLTLSALSRSDEIVLLIFGDDKRQTLDEALNASNGVYPVSRLLRQKRAPVSVYWAP